MHSSTLQLIKSYTFYQYFMHGVNTPTRASDHDSCGAQNVQYMRCCGIRLEHSPLRRKPSTLHYFGRGCQESSSESEFTHLRFLRVFVASRKKPGQNSIPTSECHTYTGHTCIPVYFVRTEFFECHYLIGDNGRACGHWRERARPKHVHHRWRWFAIASHHTESLRVFIERTAAVLRQ